jgi:hypothetical protein
MSLYGTNCMYIKNLNLKLFTYWNFTLIVELEYVPMNVTSQQSTNYAEINNLPGYNLYKM